jgi:DNA ligase 1
MIDSVYQTAGKDYLEGMGDSLDLVPIGAWWGSGRKAGWWSPILLALYNPETGALEAVCKCEWRALQLKSYG